MPPSEKCCQCLNNFTMVKLPRKLPTCQHNICQSCLRELVDTKQDMLICGFCSSVLRGEEIRVFPLNTSILLLLNEVPIVNISNPNEEDNQLLGDISGEQLCPVHKVVMDIICISDKHRICPHCALFGNHKDHRFKRLDDFEKEVIDKRKAFAQIQAQKVSLLHSNQLRIYDKIKDRVTTRKMELIKQVEEEAKRYIDMISTAKLTSIKQIDQACNELQQHFKGISPVLKFEKSKSKMEKWEKTCIDAMKYLDRTPCVEERLLSYYEGPLEIVTEGLLFIDDLGRYSQQALAKVDQSLAELQILKENTENIFERCFIVKKKTPTPNNSTLKSTDEEASQINPFLDCTSSEITLGQISVLNSTNLQAEITTLTKQMSANPLRTPITPKKQLNNSTKSVEKEKPRVSAKIQKPSQSNTAKLSAIGLKRPVSQITTLKFSPKMTKCTTMHETIPETQLKPHDLKEPEKLYLQFSKNTLSDFFDISECNLPSDSVVQYVHRARRIHKIRGLKLSNNRLTTAGFEKMSEFLHGVSNINMANNMISEAIFDVILKNRDRLESLRVVNLSHNPITLDKKASAKMEEVKRMGVIIVL